MKKKYFTDEERKAAHRENALRDYYKHKQERLEKSRELYQFKKEEKKERLKTYNKTKYGRALYLLGGYRRLDKKSERGECTLTAQWIVDNIFSSHCQYCDEDDWTKIGCDRIDSTKPHTPENCVPCCYHCNCKKHTMGYEEFMDKTIKI